MITPEPPDHEHAAEITKLASAIFATATCERITAAGDWIAEIPADPFRLWWIGKDEAEALAGLRLLIARTVALEHIRNARR